MDLKNGRAMKIIRGHKLGSNLSSLATLVPTTSQLLYHVGLQRRRSRARRAARMAGLLGAGALLGTGLATLLTPRSGPEVRHELAKRARRAKDSVRPKEGEVPPRQARL